MNWLNRWAWDILPAAFMAMIILYIVAGLERPKDECPPMYKMKAEMTKNGNVLVCKYRP